MEETKENVDPTPTTPTPESEEVISTKDNADPKPTTPALVSEEVISTEGNADPITTTLTLKTTTTTSSESLQQTVARLERGKKQVVSSISIFFTNKWFHVTELKQMAQVLQPQSALSSPVVQPPSGTNDDNPVT